MIEAMIKEVALSSSKQIIDTIYFGGGTPSLLTAGEINKLLEAVHRHFSISSNAEITLEANPDDINEIKLAEWKGAGINRFSIGVQSFNEKDLAWMNRAHNAEQALHCIRDVKKAGFENYSVDLIYGTPGLSDDDPIGIGWQQNVQTLINLDVPHISCYALTVEPGTALQKMILLKKKEETDPEKSASQFLLLMKWLTAAGYEHYEISNFAKPGYRSKHNSSYWQGKPYIGIGPSAHSFDGISRRWNVSNNTFYIQSLQQGIIPYEEELLTATQKLNEYIMTSLRTIEGIDLAFVEKNFGEAARRTLQAAGNKYLHNYKLQTINLPTGQAGYKLCLTDEGKLFADGIAADLFFEETINALQA